MAEVRSCSPGGCDDEQRLKRDGVCEYDGCGGSPPCTPSCPVACGQANGCGSNCGNGDNGAPDAPTLDPGEGGIVVVGVGEEVTVSWSSVSKANTYELELYQQGTDCSDVTAHCVDAGGTSYSFVPLVPNYYYRVRAVNTSCTAYDGLDDYGDWGDASFSVMGRGNRASICLGKARAKESL